MVKKIRRWVKKNGKSLNWLAGEIGVPKQNFNWTINHTPVRNWPVWICAEIERVTGITYTKNDLKK